MHLTTFDNIPHGGILCQELIRVKVGIIMKTNAEF
jgi:hypothetical protein